jgi:TRAP-type C4-dicarboxylate transport system permease small subunit
MALLTDVLRIAFLGTAVVLTWQMMEKMGDYKMTIIDLPMNLVYGVCLIGFTAMCLRSVWVMRIHIKRGYSVLERPESSIEDR